MSYLGRFGGNSTNDATYRLLFKLMTNKFATHITWTGKSEKDVKNYEFRKATQLVLAICGKFKKVFNNNLLILIICFFLDAVRCDDRLKKSTHQQVEIAIREWLRHSGDRMRKVS